MYPNSVEDLTQTQYEELIKHRHESIKWEIALRNAGVDNWEGFSYAMEIYEDLFKEQEKGLWNEVDEVE